MKRKIDLYLESWKNSPDRKPLLLRGARQVGKTYTARALGNNFDDYVEINFELFPQAGTIFEKNLEPERIVMELSLLTGKRITPGKTLLFFDEIQTAPKAFLALRYFYELMPQLHVIAAGSLLDFTTEELGIPVGRVSSLYIYPLSFLEFLEALGHNAFSELIQIHSLQEPLAPALHNKLLDFVGEYLAIGGMPESVKKWRDARDPFACFQIHTTLVESYRQDFNKYAKKFQIKYVSLLFDNIPLMIGKKFKFSAIHGEYRKRELAPSLDLLVTAGVVHKIHTSSGQGIPLAAHMDTDHFKALFLDIALCQSLLGAQNGTWLINPLEEYINKGELVEAFIGQELLAYSNPFQKHSLYYWQREERTSQAEIDYLIQKNNSIIPIEVKSGTGTALKSMHIFLASHTSSPYGIRISTNNYSQQESLRSYPLYALWKALNE